MSETPATPEAQPSTPVATPNAQPPTMDQPPSTPSWTDSLSEDHKAYVTNKGFKDPTSVLESYINLEKLRGVPQERLLKLPEDPSSPDWSKVWEKLGKPEKIEDYGLKLPEGGDKEFFDFALKTFHDINMTTDQAGKMIGKFNEFMQARSLSSEESFSQKSQQEEMALKKEWGLAHNQNIEIGRKAAKALGLDADTIEGMERVMGYSKLVKMLHTIGSNFREDTFVSGSDSSGDKVMTPDQAQAQIRALKQDGEFVRKFTAGDVEAKKKMDHLHMMAYPGSSTMSM